MYLRIPLQNDLVLTLNKANNNRHHNENLCKNIAIKDHKIILCKGQPQVNPLVAFFPNYKRPASRPYR